MASQHTTAVGEPGGSAPDRLLEVLLGYLAVSPWRGWPGADGMTVRDVVAGVYPAAAAAGHVPPRPN